MLVTIYTDGRVHEKGCFCAFRAKCEKGKLERVFKIPETNSINFVELRAIMLAFQAVRTQWPEAQVFFFNSDSDNVVRSFWTLTFAKNRYKVASDIKGHIEPFVSYISSLEGIEIRVKHVKGHAKDDSIRTYMNNYVDKLMRGDLRNIVDLTKPIDNDSIH